MSILAAEETPGMVWLMTAWAALAVGVVIAVALRDRNCRHAMDNESLPAAGQVPLGLAVPTNSPLPAFITATVSGFAAWLGSQIVFAVIAPPRMPTAAGGGAGVTWRPIELAVLALLAGVCGWIGCFLVLRATKTVREAGYTSVRLTSGLLHGLVGIIVALPIVFWTAELTAWLLDYFQIHHATKHPLLESMDETPNVKVISLAAFAAVVAAPFFEELLFRGLIQNGITRATRHPWAGILVASSLFALIHPWWSIPPIFVLSVLLGVVYMRTHNLWAVTLMHSLFNAYMMTASVVESSRM